MTDLELPDFVAMAPSFPSYWQNAKYPGLRCRSAYCPSDHGVLAVWTIFFDETSCRFDETNRRLDSMELNSMIRLANSYATNLTTPPSPLRNPQNQDFASFPPNGAAIDALNGPLHSHPALVV